MTRVHLFSSGIFFVLLFPLINCICLIKVLAYISLKDFMAGRVRNSQVCSGSHLYTLTMASGVDI